MADSGSSNAPPGIARITAPILFGSMINWALYGVLCIQIYVYGYNFPDDRRRLKFLVYFVFLLETAQTALTGADVYYWFMAGFGDIEGLKKSSFSPIDIPTMDAFISLIVQVFFCFRIWLLSKRIWWLCLVIAILAIAQAVGAIWEGINSAALGKYAVLKPSLYVWGYYAGFAAPAYSLLNQLWLITSAFVDILIAVAMTYLLRQRRGNENRITSYVLPRIVRLTIETNMLTATVAIISFALYIGFPNEIYYACPMEVIGKLYSNTLVVTFNNRIYFRDHPSLGDPCDSVYLDPSRHFEHQLPPIRPLSLTITDDAFRPSSSTTDLEKGRSKVVASNPAGGPPF